MSFKVLLFVVTAVAYIAANSDARVIGINNARALDKICSIECKRLDCKVYTARLDIVGCDCYECSLPWPVQMKKNNHEDDNNHGPIRLDRDIEDDTSGSDKICSIGCKRLGCKDYTPSLDIVGCDCCKCSLPWPVQMKEKNHEDSNNINRSPIRVGRGASGSGDNGGFCFYLNRGRFRLHICYDF